MNLTDIEKFRSGEVTYLLNEGNTENPVWFQTLPEDEHPTFLPGHSVVYKKSDNEYANLPDAIQSISLDPATTEIYTLTGVRVTRPMHGGIYIINGVKVKIK